MDRNGIFAALATTGIPCAEDFFREDAEGAKGSRIVVRHEGDDTTFANSRAYAKADNWSITLYSPTRDEPSEKKVVAAMGKAGVPLGNASSGYDDEHKTHWCEWDFQTI